MLFNQLLQEPHVRWIIIISALWHTFKYITIILCAQKNSHIFCFNLWRLRTQNKKCCTFLSECIDTDMLAAASRCVQRAGVVFQVVVISSTFTSRQTEFPSFSVRHSVSRPSHNHEHRILKRLSSNSAHSNRNNVPGSVRGQSFLQPTSTMSPQQRSSVIKTCQKSVLLLEMFSLISLVEHKNGVACYQTTAPSWRTGTWIFPELMSTKRFVPLYFFS